MKLRDIFILFLMVMMMLGCGDAYRYNRLVEKELASGVRNDTLFLGLYLGMERKDFYSHCWNLNKKGIVRQGSGNMTVYYTIEDERDTIQVNFYPNFYENKIWRVPVKFNYISWAPWNKHLGADSLEESIVGRFRKWYGNDFHRVMNADKQVSYYKVDGNRLISIFKDAGGTFVWAIFTDLPVYNKIEELKKQKKDTATAESAPALYRNNPVQ